MNLQKVPSFLAPFWISSPFDEDYEFFRDEPNKLTRSFDGKSFTQFGIKETENQIHISGKIMIPKEKVNIEFDKETGMLTIHGEHEVKKEESNENQKRVTCERSFQSFKQSFSLPHNAEIEKADASIENGMLVITIPKKQEEKHPQKTKLNINFK
ncbi:17.6 kda class i heat shock protein-like [Anaeramoeba ignava]|uniref:17.6 kDa class i heat shock protein-like n=1 Tax=Anaeramoeba ignava TaxID=1746090 RepID=A0A9Q0LUU9_ANAIG|nr:17.6 kda class i heat shock protein-like [Anaeramoeba ignava]